MFIVLKLLLFLFYLTFLGLWIVDREHKDNIHGLFALSLCSGLITNHILVLIFKSYMLSMIIGLGLVCISIYLKRGLILSVLNRYKRKWLFFLSPYLLLGSLYSTLVLLNPIVLWDARSIWFFHGKIFYYTEGLSLLEANSNVYFAFSYLHYPKLFPILIGQTATMAGFWNEYIPKFALILFILCTTASILSLKLDGLSKAALFLIFFGIPGNWLWNGSVDGFLAVFIGLGLLGLLMRSPNSTVMGIGFLTLAACSKDEGLILALICLGTFAVLFFQDVLAYTKNKKVYIAFILFITPILLWQNMKNKLGLSIYFTFDKDTFLRAYDRIMDIVPLQTVLLNIGQFILSLLVIYLLSLIVLFVFRRSSFSWKENSICVGTGFLYTSVLIFVYLITPFPLIWHLATSAGRVTMAVQILLGLGAFMNMHALGQSTETA